MSKVEIEVESGCECACDCGMKKAEAAGPTKDQMIAELKVLLNKTDMNGLAERQVKIDKLMADIAEYGKEED